MLHSCGGSIPSGNDSPFHCRPPNPTPTLLPPDPSSVSFFYTHKHKTTFSSLKAKATINGNSVSEHTQLTFYDLLGIPESGSLLEIKQAYKQLARKYHPDVSPPDRVEEYTQTFIRVQEAYETLSDSRRRALYDRDMAVGLHLAFSARRRFQSDEELEDTSEWKNRWKSQLSELKRRSMNKDGQGNMSWGARMRRQRDESSN